MSTLKLSTFLGTYGANWATLASDYTAGGTSLVLTAGQGARVPSAGDFWVRLGNAAGTIKRCTSRSTDTLTVDSAAADGTTDQDLASGGTVDFVIGEAAIDQLRQDLHQTGADASKSAEKAGNLYLPSDGSLLYRDSGAAFSAWGPLYPITAIALGDWTQSNTNTPTVTTTGGTVQVHCDASDGFLAYKTAPATPYRFIVAFRVSLVGVQTGSRVDIGLRESGTGNRTMISLVGISKTWRMGTSHTGGDYINDAQWDYIGNTCLRFFSVTNDGTTNRTYEISPDGKTWSIYDTRAYNADLTPDQIQIGASAVASEKGLDVQFLGAWTE